ncbi:hypothetical protein CIL03_18110 [Virgibacillus indicus]|uniref:Uncharacterized protein n=1 Tax=Virgibacillus indicus TaxID=2024554 RepID=A0A265N5T7_9BACI|nr:hypothetical protein [Virgibacillus indicus]OZU87207.1 hypothetical protein CIL03_18110 [Virgibacillus indicus]
MNSKIIPINRSMAMKEKHHGKEEWKMFARKIQKNPFVKNFLLNRENHKCAWCGWNIDNKFVAHHIDYDHVCEFKVMREYPNPTVKRPKRVVRVPDCERCCIANPNLFSDCMSKLTPVHQLCNFNIAKHVIEKTR